MWTPVQKARENPKSFRAAIDAMCAECVCWSDREDAIQSPRWLIGNCEITDCALWHLRPYQHRKSDPIPSIYEGTAHDSNDGD